MARAGTPNDFIDNGHSGRTYRRQHRRRQNEVDAVSGLSEQEARQIEKQVQEAAHEQLRAQEAAEQAQADAKEIAEAKKQVIDARNQAIPTVRDIGNLRAQAQSQAGKQTRDLAKRAAKATGRGLWGATKAVGRGTRDYGPELAIGGLAAAGAVTVGAARNAVNFGVFSLIFPIILYWIDVAYSFNGVCVYDGTGACNLFSLSVASGFFRSASGFFFLALCLFLTVFMKERTTENLTFGIIFSLLIALAAGSFGNPVVFAHIIFALGVYIFALQRTEFSTIHYWFLFVVFADLYLFPMIAPQLFAWQAYTQVELNRFIFPIWIFFFVGLMKTGFSKKILHSLIILFYLTLFYPAIMQSAVASEGVEAGRQAAEDARQSATGVIDRIKEWAFSFTRSQIALATGHRGQIEQNRYENLGVYFTRMDFSQPRYYLGEPITIWGGIRSKSHAGAVFVNFQCFKIDSKGNLIEIQTREPKNTIPLFELQQEDIKCIVLPSTTDQRIESGKENKYRFYATYNFRTDAYVQAYFMDQAKYQSFIREGKSPVEILRSFGRTEVKPKAVFTNGPVNIGAEVGTRTESLVPVAPTYITSPSIGFSLNNRERTVNQEENIISTWKGDIKKLKELVLVTPPGVTIPNLNQCNPDTAVIADDPDLGSATTNTPGSFLLNCPCNVPFKEYTRQECSSVECVQQGVVNEEACKLTSCGKDLLECRAVCDQAYVIKTGTTQQAVDDAKELCRVECTELYNKCDEDCSILLGYEGEENNNVGNAYALDTESLQKLTVRDEFKDVDKNRNFFCAYHPTSEVLDDAPVTARNFRIRAKYEYFVTQDKSVKVIADPTRTGFVGTSSVLATNRIIERSIDQVAPEVCKGTLLNECKTLDPHLVLAIMTQESACKHCCVSSEKTGVSCEDNGELTCDADHVMQSKQRDNDGELKTVAVGIMQVRYDDALVNKDTGQTFQQLRDQIADKVCDADALGNKQTVYDKECNIRVGLHILFENYVRYKDGFTGSTKACKDGTKKADGTDQTFGDYRKWDAALRGYHGWGCNTGKSGAIDNYVPQVLTKLNEIKSGEFAFSECKALEAEPPEEFKALVGKKLQLRAPMDLHVEEITIDAISPLTFSTTWKNQTGHFLKIQAGKTEELESQFVNGEREFAFVPADTCTITTAQTTCTLRAAVAGTDNEIILELLTEDFDGTDTIETLVATNKITLEP